MRKRSKTLILRIISRLFLWQLCHAEFYFDCFICISQSKDHKGKDGTEKPGLSPKSQKAQKKIKPPDTTGAEMNIMFPPQT